MKTRMLLLISYFMIVNNTTTFILYAQKPISVHSVGDSMYIFNFPKAKKGFKQVALTIPKIKNEQEAMVELFVGEMLKVDACNSHSLSGEIQPKKLESKGYVYYEVHEGKNRGISTAIACPGSLVEKFITMKPILVPYSSYYPVMIYIPKKYEVKYKVWTAGKELFDVHGKAENPADLNADTLKSKLLRDCPEEKIINKMPTVGNSKRQTPANTYYIYKGTRKEISDFDSVWIRKNCPNIKETEVQ